MVTLFKRFADGTITKANERLNMKCTELESRIRILELERDELAAVVARNLKRVEAETAAATRRIADYEATPNVNVQY